MIINTEFELLRSVVRMMVGNEEDILSELPNPSTYKGQSIGIQLPLNYPDPCVAIYASNGISWRRIKK